MSAQSSKEKPPIDWGKIVEQDSLTQAAFVIEQVAALIPPIEIKTTSETARFGELEVSVGEVGKSSLPSEIKEYLLTEQTDEPLKIRLLIAGSEGKAWIGRSASGRRTVALMVTASPVFNNDRVQVDIIPSQHQDETIENYQSRLQELGLLPSWQHLSEYIQSVGSIEIAKEVLRFAASTIQTHKERPKSSPVV